MVRSDQEAVEVQLVGDVVKSAYLFSERTGRSPGWRRIVRWTERAMRDSLADERYKEFKNILTRLHDWYFRVYEAGDESSGMINIPLSVPLGLHYTYYDQLDILGIGNKIELFDIVGADFCRPRKGQKVFNEISIHARIWGVREALKICPDVYTRIIISPKSVRARSLQVSQDSLERTGRYIKYLLTGMINNIAYPSVSEQCDSCPFLTGCSI
jgi:hypothetical protein